jgi:anti-anti-sigma regulatory factor
MTGSSGKVLACREAGELYLLVLGRVTSHHSPAMRQYAEEGLACGAMSVEVDLRDCTHCDSTFLGTLLHLQRRWERHAKGSFRLVGPSVEVRQILAQIGAEKLFCTVNDSSRTDLQMTWQQLEDSVERVGPFRFKENVVEAHQALASAGGELAQRFGPLADSLEREIQHHQQSRHSG